ncbi:MAG: (2Fe-2S) ferredoxin domain-containing protein [Cytophagaceae bacterium]|jgi:(2Fe-2S) ferredoxin|nr:(2Fe-2S) ferredoxin domain-containing protein [Cytophagaceae bacterium]
MKYKKHIFVCTNERNDGRECCGEQKGMELVACLKNLIKEHKLQKEMRAQRAGCFDTCQHGPAMVVYPEGVFYGNVSVEDLTEIFNEHLVAGNPVERLRIDLPQ